MPFANNDRNYHDYVDEEQLVSGCGKSSKLREALRGCFRAQTFDSDYVDGWHLPNTSPTFRTSQKLLEKYDHQRGRLTRMGSRCDVCDRWSLHSFGEACRKSIQVAFPDIKRELIQLERWVNTQLPHREGYLVCVIVLQKGHAIRLHVLFEVIFQLLINATTFTPPRFTCSGEPDGPSSMWGRMLHKIRGGQHTKVSKVRLTNQRRGFFALRVMAHCYGRLLKAPVLNGIKTLIRGLLTALSFLQKPQKEIETASPKSCHSLWHLHLEQSCLQTCVSTCQIHSNEVATRHLPGQLKCTEPQKKPKATGTGHQKP